MNAIVLVKPISRIISGDKNLKPAPITQAVLTYSFLNFTVKHPLASHACTNFGILHADTLSVHFHNHSCLHIYARWNSLCWENCQGQGPQNWCIYYIMICICLRNMHERQRTGFRAFSLLYKIWLRKQLSMARSVKVGISAIEMKLLRGNNEQLTILS